MIVDWSKVKKQTRWDYEFLIEKLLAVLAYSFVQENYNHTLNYVLRWVLLFRIPMREFFDASQKADSSYLEMLKRQKFRFNLDVLEFGRSKNRRGQFADLTGMPVVILTHLVHKADISRLAYVRGETVNYLCGGGYDTLEKIATADLAEMEQKMDAYYRTLGKSLSDFRAVIPLSWMIGGAKILPRVVES